MTQQTPSLGLEFPEPGDHTRLWEHYQALAEGVDDLVQQPGGGTAIPQPLTMYGSWGSSTGHPLTLTRFGPIVMIAGQIRHTTGLAVNDYQPVCTLPSWARPAVDCEYRWFAGSGTAASIRQARTIANTTAGLEASTNGEASWGYLQIMYPTTDGLP